MGHGASKPDPGMELRPGMKLIWRKIEEVKRRKRVRRPSIVSTVELLQPEEREGLVNDDPAREGAGPPETTAAEENVKEKKKIDEEEKAVTAAEEKEEEEKRELEFRGKREEEEKDDDENGRKLGSLAAYEDMPGSPSFRFYCTDLARVSEDDSSVKSGDVRRKDKPQEMKEEEKKAHEREASTDFLNPSEESDTKPWKKDKGRRLKALTKAPGHMYNLFNVRNCYCNSSSASDQDNAGLLSRKASSQI